MSTALDEQVSTSLPKGTLLVLFEFLARRSDGWRRSENGQQTQNRFVLEAPDPGELAALWHLEGAIESTLPELFAPDYKAMIDVWKQKLRSEACL